MYLLRESCTDTYCLVELEGGWANNPFGEACRLGRTRPDCVYIYRLQYPFSRALYCRPYVCCPVGALLGEGLHSPRSVAPPQAPPLLDLGAQPLERDLQRVTSRIG